VAHALLEDVTCLVVVRKEDGLVVTHVLDANSCASMGGGADELDVESTQSVEV